MLPQGEIGLLFLTASKNQDTWLLAVASHITDIRMVSSLTLLSTRETREDLNKFELKGNGDTFPKSTGIHRGISAHRSEILSHQPPGLGVSKMQILDQMKYWWNLKLHGFCHSSAYFTMTFPQ